MTANNSDVIITHLIETEDGIVQITLPYDALSQLGWTENEEVFWTIEDGKIILEKKE